MKKLTPPILFVLALMSPVAALAEPAKPTADYAKPVAATSSTSSKAQATTDYAQPVFLSVDRQAVPFTPNPLAKTPAQVRAEKQKAKARARARYIRRIREAPVGSAWAPILNLYTGGSYSTGHVNQLWQGAPRNRTVLAAAVHYHLPYRLLLGVWGAESGWGRAWNHFGLIGPATGNLSHDAYYAARLFAKFYRQSYGGYAVR